MAVGGNNIEQIGNGSPAGATLGATAAKLAGMHGLACIQASTISLSATTAATSTSPFGYSEAQANGIVSKLNSVITALINKGIIAAS
jgi:hypothetical protein